MKGQLPLLDAAKELQAELLEMPTFDDSETEELLGEEAKLIQNVKKVALLAAGVAVQKYMDKLSDQQGVLAGITEIVGEAYAMESARLRALKMAASRGEAEADVAIKLTRLFIYETLGKIDLAAREVLAACSEGDELRTLLAALRRLTRYVPINTLGLREEVADYFIEKEKYQV
jgi:hypothetical protein